MASITAKAGGASRAPELSPVMGLFREWDEAYAAAGDADLPDEELDRRCEKFAAIGRDLLRMPVEGPADFAAKFLVHTHYGDFDVSELDGDRYDILADAKALTRGGANPQGRLDHG